MNVAYERTSFAKREEGKKFVGTAAAFKCIAAGVYDKGNKAPLLDALCFKEFSVLLVAVLAHIRFCVQLVHYYTYSLSFDSCQGHFEDRKT